MLINKNEGKGSSEVEYVFTGTCTCGCSIIHKAMGGALGVGDMTGGSERSIVIKTPSRTRVTCRRCGKKYKYEYSKSIIIKEVT